MNTQASELSNFIKKRAKSQGLTMTELAALCGFSRTTLYRYLRNETAPGEMEKAAFAKALHLSESDKVSLQALIDPRKAAYAPERSYSDLNSVLFNGPEPEGDFNVNFAYHYRGDKYLRTSAEMIDTIVTDCAAKDAEIRIEAINCVEEPQLSFFRRLADGLFAASPYVTMEHLISFAKDDAERNASTFRQLLYFLGFSEYRALYSSHCLRTQNGELFANDIHIDVQTSQHDNPPSHIYYSISLYSDGLSHCIRYESAALRAYIKSNYDHIKTSYRETLLQMRNLQAFNQTLEAFENSGDYSLFKPDLCYNDVPPQAFSGLLSRMTEAERAKTIQLIMGQKLTRLQIKNALQSLLTTMEQRYQNSSQHMYRLICCREGLANFMKTGLLTGNIADLPPFSMPERALILQALRDRVSASGGLFSVLILKDRILANGTIMGVNRERGLLIDFGSVRRRGFSQNALLSCPALSSLLADYAYSEELENKAYSREEALSLIDEMLKRVKK